MVSFSNQRFALQDLLTVPVQRFLKYPLLVHEMLKRSEANSPAHHKLKSALDCIQVSILVVPVQDGGPLAGKLGAL